MIGHKTVFLMMLACGMLGLPLYRSFSRQPTGTPTPTTMPVIVADEMGDAPADCGILAEPMAIDPLIPQAIGTWPLWLAVPNVGGASKGVLFMPKTHYQKTPQLVGWWSTKVGWFIRQSYVGMVEVQAVNVADGSPMYFHFDTEQPVMTATLNAAEPGGFVEGLTDWAFFPSNVWVSKAGCYRLDVRWEGGQWQQVIAVGYLDLPSAP